MPVPPNLVPKQEQLVVTTSLAGQLLAQLAERHDFGCAYVMTTPDGRGGVLSASGGNIPPETAVRLFRAIASHPDRHKPRSHVDPRQPLDPAAPEYAAARAACERSLEQMRVASDVFYALAVESQAHRFVEINGIASKYAQLCDRLHKAGGDHIEAAKLPMEDHDAAYLGEKLGCMFAPTFAGRPDLVAAFLAEVFDIEDVRKACAERPEDAMARKDAQRRRCPSKLPHGTGTIDVQCDDVEGHAGDHGNNGAEAAWR